MDNDDRQVGRVLSRREVMQLLTTGGVAAAGGWGATMLARGGGAPADPSTPPACVVRPELEEGPFFVDHQLNRSDLRTDPVSGAVSTGLPLALTLNLSRADAGCTPLPGAVVDLWHCDARGVYSGVSGPGQPPQGNGGKALRGYQVSDAQGTVRFTTIYPGWYQGRTVHIHFKIRTAAAPTGAHEFTSQLFFDDALTDRIHKAAPYASHGPRDTTNRTDGVFAAGGESMLLGPVEKAGGLAASFALGVDLSDAAAGQPDGRGGGRGRGSFGMMG